jgi:hypothetical protein
MLMSNARGLTVPTLRTCALGPWAAAGVDALDEQAD